MKRSSLLIIIGLLGCRIKNSIIRINYDNKSCLVYTEDTVKVSEEFFVLNDFYNERNKYLFTECIEAKNNNNIIKDSNRCTFSKPLNDLNLSKIKIYQVFSTDGIILSDIFLVIDKKYNTSEIYIPWVKCDGDPNCITYEDFEKLLRENSSGKRFEILKDRLYKCLDKNSVQRMRFPAK
ncbi:MAG: hypothetical protein RMJ53_10565 [Chitinophagales bacterium]|nr:hypothetical protein [Chitinophagales bacterium]